MSARTGEEEGELEQEKVVWDYYGPAWTKIMQTMRKEKDRRHHELLLIDRRVMGITNRERKLREWKKQLEQRESEITSREQRISEAEPLLSVARRLQSQSTDFETAIPWTETVTEKAEVERIDHKTALVRLAQELKMYRAFGGLKKQIEKANQELALLNMESMQKQQALTVLKDLLNRGVTESQIVQLIDFAGKWTKYWQYSIRGSRGGGNGDSNNNPAGNENPGNGNKSNGIGGREHGSKNPGNGHSGGNFLMNYLVKIRLNLLKSTNMNMLNRMEANSSCCCRVSAVQSVSDCGADWLSNELEGSPSYAGS